MSGVGCCIVYWEIGFGGWFNGFIVDYLEKCIFWIDVRLDVIYLVCYDGFGYMEVFWGYEFLLYLFVVMLYGGEVYWIDW